MRKRFIVLFIVFLFITLFIALYIRHKFEANAFRSLHGNVIEAGTGVPIEGAVVVRHWAICGFAGCQPYGVNETISDKDGKFSIPKKDFDINFKIMTMGNIVEKPLFVYKSGYKYVSVTKSANKDIVIKISKLPISPYVRMEAAVAAQIQNFDFVDRLIDTSMRGCLYLNAINDEINSLLNSLTQQTTVTRSDASGTEVFIMDSSIIDLDFYDDKGILFFDKNGGIEFYKYGKSKNTLTKASISWGKEKECDSTIGKNRYIYILEDELTRKCPIGVDIKPVAAQPSPLVKIQIDKKTGKFVSPTPEPTPFGITPMTPYYRFNEKTRTFTLSRRKSIFISSGIYLEKFKEDGTKICEMKMPEINIGPYKIMPNFHGLAPVSNDSVYGLGLTGRLSVYYKSGHAGQYYAELLEIDGKCNVVNSKTMEFDLEPKGIASTPDDKVVIADDAGFSVYNRNYDLFYRHNFDANTIGMTNIKNIKIDHSGNVFLIDEWHISINNWPISPPMQLYNPSRILWYKL